MFQTSYEETKVFVLCTKDMQKSGIIDPLLVTKSALINAVSVATTILSTDCVINNIRIDESNRK